jgi:hypothetical protein
MTDGDPLRVDRVGPLPVLCLRVIPLAAILLVIALAPRRRSALAARLARARSNVLLAARALIARAEPLGPASNAPAADKEVAAVASPRAESRLCELLSSS